MNIQVPTVDDPPSQQQLQEELKEDFHDLMQAGVEPTVIIGAYLVAIWRFMIAYYGGFVTASIQLSNITTQLLQIGPRLEAEIKGHKVH